MRSVSLASLLLLYVGILSGERDATADPPRPTEAELAAKIQSCKDFYPDERNNSLCRGVTLAAIEEECQTNILISWKSIIVNNFYLQCGDGLAATIEQYPDLCPKCKVEDATWMGITNHWNLPVECSGEPSYTTQFWRCTCLTT